MEYWIELLYDYKHFHPIRFWGGVFLIATFVISLFVAIRCFFFNHLKNNKNSINLSSIKKY